MSTEQQDPSIEQLKQFLTSVKAFKMYAESQGWTLKQGKINKDLYQVVLGEGSNKVQVNFHGNGKIIAQGASGKVLAASQKWATTNAQTFTPPISLESLAEQLTPIIIEAPALSIPAVPPTNSAGVKSPSPSSSPALSLPSRKLLESKPIGSGSAALNWAYEHIGPQVYNFLPETSRDTYLSGVTIWLLVKSGLVKLPDYTSLIVPFAHTYEGFIVEMVLRLGLVSQESLQEHDAAKVTERCLNILIHAIEHNRKNGDWGLISTLECAWEDVRNRVLTASISAGQRYTSAIVTEQDIYIINRAMRRGYEYLVSRGVEIDTGPLYAVVNPESSTEPIVTGSDLSLAVSPNGHSNDIVDEQPLVTAKMRIGTDESGKSDYFGPLVVSAVYVDEETEEQLLALGVRDSKSLKTEQVLALAEQIKVLCPHEIWCIEPAHFNELCKEPNTSNQILADGHALVIAHLYERTGCELVITDQFGPESLMIDALMKRGCKVTLAQRPHAESDCAVAAASIIARATFLQQMEALSMQCGKILPRGSTELFIIPIGREIVADGGLPALGKVAKLYIKTTQSIFSPEMLNGSG